MDATMSVLKIVLVAISLPSIIKIGNGKKGGYLGLCLFISIVLFMTGMEMSTHSETPWHFLFFEAKLSDWNSAIIGGVAMLALPLILYAVVGKDIHKITQIGKK
ncbi:TPA: hypothetical protein ACVO4S_001763 [Vibrio diabolicus]|uniref:hypothetical protein n=1 Tax=Vibrio diabolicus TaxID=50719 RepID=UPI00211BFCE4|nr:hypothetical protein [Vibrio diabolicus]MCQ9247822.1 hypothetical protein [Vibrio diabolicus]